MTAVASQATAYAEQRSLFILFGPSAAEPARQGARAAAQTARHWLRTPDSSVEIRWPGLNDGLPVSLKVDSKEFEQSLVDVATKVKDSDPTDFLSALDSTAQALSHRPGVRVLAVILSSPPLSSEAEKNIAQVIDFCRENLIRIVVLDPSESSEKSSRKVLEELGSRTGGAMVSQAKALDSTVQSIVPVTAAKAEEASNPVAAPVARPEPAATPAAGENPAAKFTLPVRTRFIRTSGRGGTGSSLNLNVGGSSGAQATGATMAEAAGSANDNTGPLRGLLFVESPINALKFDIDDAAGTFTAKARLTQIVRNSKDKVVWRAQKEVTLRGPLRKLEARRAGNLYYMRGVTLPGSDKFTLEATVEDLLADCSGTVRQPLKTGSTTPGLMVSDALFVRPLRADRFEADQNFNYDGLALAPILEPEFHAEEPIDLQLYFVIYPDRYGAQPEMDLELLRNGKSVARLPLPFKTKIYDTALEGRHVSITGSQAQEFPYLANMKGAKLGPGTYEARITIRQSRSALSRSVPFRVIGTAPARASNPGRTMLAGGLGGPTVPLPGQMEDESVDVALPEVDPVSLKTEGIALSSEEQARVWAEAAENASGYSSHLPNFRCSQETRRLKAPIKTPEQFREADTFKDELVYEGGEESYRTIEINGVKSDASIRDQKGVHSRGEFGTMLSALFSPKVGATYKWAGQAMAGGVLCDVFEVGVTTEKSNFALYFNGHREVAGYTGRVFIDGETALVRRLTIQGEGLPKEFALQSPVFSLEYGMVKVGPQDYLLPLRSILQVRQGKFVVRNETVFREYRKFEASSEVQF